MSLNIRNWCTPAYFYFIISIIAILIMSIQNYGNTNVYCLGDYSCGVTSTFLIFVIKILYVLFWTWILNLIARVDMNQFHGSCSFFHMWLCLSRLLTFSLCKGNLRFPFDSLTSLLLFIYKIKYFLYYFITMICNVIFSQCIIK